MITMKRIKIYLVAIACSAFYVSCDNDPTAVETVLSDVTSGGILRTLESAGRFDMFRVANTFSVTVEQQDETNGELIDRVDITVDFVDNNRTGATGDDTNLGVPFGTIPGSEFTLGERGLPTADFSYSMQEALTALGVDLTEVLPGDRIAINLTLFFTDGRSFSADDAAVTVTGGSFFSSPFAYSLLIDDGITFGRQAVNENVIDLAPEAVNESYLVNLSIDDLEEGSLLETLNIYRRFRDLTIDPDNPDISQAEALFATFPIATIPVDADGVKMFEYEIPLMDLLGPGVTVDRLALGDDFRLRYEIITTDGRIVTTNAPGTEYFDVVPTR